MEIKKVAVDEIVESSMMEFSAYTLLQRAIPDLRDGFKPVYRRILFSMNRMGATRLTKSATVAGEVMKIHPHGSSYTTMVGMAQNDRHTKPLITGKGNFGNYTSRDLEPAAERYTESKLSEISIEIMRDLDKNVVEFIDNYDGTIKIPSVLPTHFPVILMYAQSGIGVGFSSSMASYNLIEVCDAVQRHLLGDEIPVLIPDFATGGFIINDNEAFKQLNHKGMGSVLLRGKAIINKNEIIITEIPYSTTREVIIEKIVDLSKAGKLKEITNINDLTGLNGMEISITARKNTDMNELLSKLYKLTPLQHPHSSNMNVLYNGKPVVLGVHQIIKEWVLWRKEIVKKGIENDLAMKKKKLHLAEGLDKIFENIDEVVEIIRKTKENSIEAVLIESFGVDATQATFISNMKLRNINQEYITKKNKDTEKLKAEIIEDEKTLHDDFKLRDIILNQLEHIKNTFGTSRKTEIINIDKKLAIAPVVEAVENYPVKLIITKDGYVSKIKGSIEPALKPNDMIVKVIETENDSELLIFSDDALCHKLSVASITETKTNQIGSFIPGILKDTKINIVGYSVLDSIHKYVVFGYENNKVAKIDVKAFEGNRKILKNAYNSSQKLVNILTLMDDRELVLSTSKTIVNVSTGTLTTLNQRNATGVYVTRKGILESIEVKNNG